MNTLQRLNITDAAKLAALNDIIHDEYFELEDITYDKERGLVEIPFRRIFHNHQPPRIIQRKWFSKVGEVDVLRCLLRISHVEQFDTIDKSQIGPYSFNDVEHVAGSNSLTFQCCEDCELRLTITRLSIEYTAVEYRGKAKITYHLFGESNDSKVYE